MEHRAVGFQKIPVLRGAIENLRQQARTQSVLRIAARRAKRDGMIAGDRIHQVHAIVEGLARLGEITAREDWTGMIDRVNFEADSFIQKLLELRICRIHLAGHDADRRAAIDLLEAGNRGAEEFLVAGGFAHVIDGDDDHRIDTFFPHPLRRNQLRE